MSLEAERSTTPTPPAGEEIHLPGPTIKPLVTAVAITFIIVGTTVTWTLSIIGGILFIVTAIMWIRDTRRDVAALPEQHGNRGRFGGAFRGGRFGGALAAGRFGGAFRRGGAAPLGAPGRTPIAPIPSQPSPPWANRVTI